MEEVGTSLGPALIAEIGDVRHFTHKGALVAYAGVDTDINQSGTYNQKSIHSSKRGSPQLQKTLFKVMSCLIQVKPEDNSVYKFLDKKRSRGKLYYVYTRAGSNEFLRIYYGKV